MAGERGERLTHLDCEVLGRAGEREGAVEALLGRNLRRGANGCWKKSPRPPGAGQAQ